ncbi:MAG: hypothetical protein WBK91_03190 [Alphaproteobacteria bacterium]
MDKLIAAFFMFLGIMQAQIMFAGAITVSAQTDWPRLGAYFQRQIVEWQNGDDIVVEPVAKPVAKKRTNRHINLSTGENRNTK